MSEISFSILDKPEEHHEPRMKKILKMHETYMMRFMVFKMFNAIKEREIDRLEHILGESSEFKEFIHKKYLELFIQYCFEI
jgi:hypothetical protein